MMGKMQSDVNMTSSAQSVIVQSFEREHYIVEIRMTYSADRR